MRRKIVSVLASVLFLAGCIHNDLPYPIVVPGITSISVQDAVKIDIDHESREVTVHVSETTDLRRVVIQSVEFDVDFTKPSVQLLGMHDLTSPLEFTLTTYQDYEWTITAIRTVERYFTVAGQIGSSVIDEYNCRVIASVPEGTDISDMTVTSLKLGPKDITTYSLAPEQMKDFSAGIDVDVTAFGETQTWSIYVEETDISVEVSKVNPWTTSAYVTAMAIAGNETVFHYREKGTQDWTAVDAADVTSDGGTFTAHIKGLLPSTGYEVMVSCGQDQTSPVEFTTEPDTKLPNGSFEYTSIVSGTNYYKFYDPSCGVEEGMTMFWGSGNGEGPEGVNGSANMGIIITTVDKESKVDGQQSVCAQTSQMAGILAAGNLFTGQFAGLVNTEGGKVNFGRPWTTRPVAIRIYARYSTSNIDIIGKKMPPGVTLTKEDYDRAQIKIALGTWDYRTYGGTSQSPVHINTTDAATFVDFSKDAATVAYGDIILHKDAYILNGSRTDNASTGEWTEYVIPLNYNDLETNPTHIIISCASSQFGDYFTGCSTSRLWLDNFELIY